MNTEQTNGAPMNEELLFSHPVDTTYTAPAGTVDANGDAEDKPVAHPVFSDKDR